MYHLGAVLGDAAALVLLAYHEAGNVLQEEERDAPEAAQLDKVCRLQRRLAEEDAVVGDDADEESVDTSEARDQRRRVPLLEFVEPRTVDDARDHLAYVIGLAQIEIDDAVDFRRVVRRIFRRCHVDG